MQLPWATQEPSCAWCDHGCWLGDCPSCCCATTPFHQKRQDSQQACLCSCCSPTQQQLRDTSSAVSCTHTPVAQHSMGILNLSGLQSEQQLSIQICMVTRGPHCSAACTVCDRGHRIKLLAEHPVGLAGLLRRFAANGWPITTTTNEGLGVQAKDLIIAAAVSMGAATSANIAGGLLDTYAALQLVPDDPSSSTSTPALSSGDTPSSPSPEEANPFAASSAIQSGDFGDASSGVAPAPPLSTQQQAVSLAVQAAAAAAGNTTLNATHSIFGSSQPVVFIPCGLCSCP